MARAAAPASEHPQCHSTHEPRRPVRAALWADGAADFVYDPSIALREDLWADARATGDGLTVAHIVIGLLVKRHWQPPPRGRGRQSCNRWRRDERCRPSVFASGGRSYRHRADRAPARSSAGGIVNLSRDGMLLRSVARRLGARKSLAMPIGLPASQSRGAGKLASTPLT
jgi:hypothetical protein